MDAPDSTLTDDSLPGNSDALILSWMLDSILRSFETCDVEIIKDLKQKQ